MFEGYYGRRRLKTTLAVVVGLLVLMALVYQRQEPVFEPYEIQPDPIIRPRTPSPPLVPILKAPGVLSAIQFKNSPYLNLESLSTDIIPIMVLSKASNIEVRDAIRRTWGFDRLYRNDTIRMKVFFLVGTDDFMTQRIHMEQIVFDDVIQITIPDMYSFSAYKELSAMMWVRSYLPEIPLYIKTEDDVIINMKVFVDQLLPTIESVSDQQLIIGWFGFEHSVERGTYQKFIDAVIPSSSGQLHYAMNLLYAVTAISADLMIDALSRVEFIEYPGDPFVTGILRDAAHVQITNLETYSGDYKYELGNGACKTAFQRNPNLLICTSALHIGSIRSMPEYFEAWNVLIGQKD